MRRYLFLVPIIFLISCEKDSVEPNGKNVGFVANYLKNNPGISIIKTTESNIVYVGGVSTYRGYIFTPSADLNIIAIGGRIAEPGTYKFEIYKMDDWWLSTMDTLLADNITITDVRSFQYKNTSGKIFLSKNQRYLVRYFNESHNSVYDAGTGWSSTDTKNYIPFPVKMDDIEIEVPYYTYHTKHNGGYWSYQSGTFNSGILRGLIDFRYELAK